uniref:Uncharacterized protein n=1 Tax=Cacopsylla melanoneura TaxID=428564 RepID=A0A8D8WYE6_9HEMI
MKVRRTKIRRREVYSVCQTQRPSPAGDRRPSWAVNPVRVDLASRSVSNPKRKRGLFSLGSDTGALGPVMASSKILNHSKTDQGGWFPRVVGGGEGNGADLRRGWCSTNKGPHSNSPQDSPTSQTSSHTPAPS